MRTLLTVLCCLTLLGTALLTLSLIIWRPTRVNYAEWSVMAALFVSQSVFTLAAIAGAVSGSWTRWLLLAGGGAVIWIGASWAHATLSGGHFEGYALVLGSILVVQGALTVGDVVVGSVRRA